MYALSYCVSYQQDHGAGWRLSRGIQGQSPLVQFELQTSQRISLGLVILKCCTTTHEGPQLLRKFYATRWKYAAVAAMFNIKTQLSASVRRVNFSALQITKGLVQKYGPERVRDTPITEVC